MLINSELLDIKKWADEGVPNSQLILFWVFKDGDMGAKNFELATHYLEKFITENDIETCINACLEIRPITPLFYNFSNDADNRAFQYFYHISAVGVFLQGLEEFEKAALWYKKAIDLTERYLVNKGDFLQNAMYEEVWAYEKFEEVEQYFNPIKYQNFYLAWEVKELLSVSVANNNVAAFSQYPLF